MKNTPAISCRDGFRDARSPFMFLRSWCRRCARILENGRALQDLLHQTIVRYTQALKQERKHKLRKVKK